MNFRYNILSGNYIFHIFFIHIGGESNEDFDAMIGKDGQVAMASIVINGDKVNAISTMQSSRDRSKVDFRILKYSAGFPTISVTDDVSSWQVGK